MGTFFIILIIGIALYYNREKIFSYVAPSRAGGSPTRRKTLNHKTLVYIGTIIFAIPIIFSIRDPMVRNIIILVPIAGFVYNYRKPFLRFFYGFHQGYHGYSDKNKSTPVNGQRNKQTVVSANMKSTSELAKEDHVQSALKERNRLQQKYRISFVEAEDDEVYKKTGQPADQDSTIVVEQKKEVIPVVNEKESAPQENIISWEDGEEPTPGNVVPAVASLKSTSIAEEGTKEHKEEVSYATEKDSPSIPDTALSFLKRIFSSKPSGHRYERSEKRSERQGNRNSDGYLK